MSRKKTAQSKKKIVQENPPLPLAKEPVPGRKRNALQIETGVNPFQKKHASLGKFRAKSKRINQELGKYSLTEKQAKVLDFMTNYVKKVGFPPTVREVADYFKISAKAAHDHIRSIAKKGYIRIFPGAARGMEIVDLEGVKGSNTPVLKTVMESTTIVPLIGSIAAGAPILAEENIDSYLSFPKSMLPMGGQFFALRVRGDSMEGAGIFDGDIAVLKQVNDVNSEVKNGDIVAALIDGDATLKTYEKARNKINLKAENPKYDPISLSAQSNASIVGKLVGIYRKY
ncbi:MAG: transcriptional repressor LexA [Candidatus Hydrogenedentota bacterium]|nr:MAG: transcriptional repressor LexA [Candidatus Hydrogenedentota bacterium]